MASDDLEIDDAVREDAAPPIDRGVSEIGALLGEHVAAFASCRGIILTDDDGHPIDFARRPDRISRLDLQIVGAQIERALTALRTWTAGRGLGRPIVTLGAERGILMSAALAGDLTLAALYAARGEIEPLAVIEASFAGLSRRLGDLLGG
ncbi:MAG: hypothetical protein H6711_09005 [Myxococcales bacterium]|nr:hypothetical protein [Myxococcales bacterium]